VHEQVHGEQRWALFKQRIAARVNSKFKDVVMERSAMALKKAKAVRVLGPAPHSARLSQTTSQTSTKRWSKISNQPATSRNHQPSTTSAPAPPALPLHSDVPDSLEIFVASNATSENEGKHSPNPRAFDES
jgi:hypothetical protein